MQIIVRVKCSPEEYFGEQMQTSMSRPKLCPNCGQAGMLVALGYYERWVAGIGAADLRLLIRRFRCRACGRSVSVLPDFAQPYRLIRNTVIEGFFDGQMDRAGVQQSSDLLICYWRRFAWWLPELRRKIGRSFGRAPPTTAPRTWWRFIIAFAGDLRRATRRLIGEMRVTIFGRYCCHQPFRAG